MTAAECALAVGSRRCAKPAYDKVAGLDLCAQHLTQVASGIHYGLLLDPDFRATVRTRLVAIDSAEKAKQKQARTEARHASSVVYFVERDGFLKIGFSCNLTNRLAAISRGSAVPEGMTVGPVRLLATTPGDRGNEGYFHAKFAEHRVAGEWFLLTDDLWSFIVGLKDYTGEPRCALRLRSAA